MKPTARHALGAVAVGLVLGLGSTGCTGDSEPEPSGASPSEAAPLETTAKIGAVAGKIAPARAKLVVPEVTAVVDGWLDAAYVGGDYPREDFTDAFPGFTLGAAEEATKDIDLMSNADIGTRIDGVTATARRVNVDVLGAKGAPAGATARVRLVFTTSGDLERTVSVTGRLRLTETDGGWQVFAYDVAKGQQR